MEGVHGYLTCSADRGDTKSHREKQMPTIFRPQCVKGEHEFRKLFGGEAEPGSQQLKLCQQTVPIRLAALIIVKVQTIMSNQTHMLCLDSSSSC